MAACGVILPVITLARPHRVSELVGELVATRYRRTINARQVRCTRILVLTGQVRHERDLVQVSYDLVSRRHTPICACSLSCCVQTLRLTVQYYAMLQGQKYVGQQAESHVALVRRLF